MAAIPLPGLDAPIAPSAETLWGIDPSSLRVSVGVLPLGRAFTLSLPRRSGLASTREAWWYAQVVRELVPWLQHLVAEKGAPALVRLEEPFGGPRGQRQNPTSHRVFGVILAALELAAPGVQIDMVGPSSWKMRALGQGHGHAEKPVVMAWARRVYGYAGALQDEADALAIVTSLAVDRAR